jgi:hypothetical protein
MAARQALKKPYNLDGRPILGESGHPHRVAGASIDKTDIVR